ncbi:MAG: ceramidase domain-containing protein [Thiobacillaceae bacterium]|nr:ceramidase domain-containing protein [Thiobacillaceae bacterium]
MGGHLDLYCERTAAGLAAEPLNTLSNLAFLVAAGLLLGPYRRAYRGRLRQGWDLALLIALIAAIGIGSGLWHLTAQVWALWLDVLPILAYISLFLLVALRRVAGLTWPATLALFAFYHAVNSAVQASLPPDTLNGSVFYLPTWVALALLALWLTRRGLPGAREFTLATGLLAVSLTLRTLDLSVCAWLPVGTHFLWHVLNALVLYRLTAGLVRTVGNFARG